MYKKYIAKLTFIMSIYNTRHEWINRAINSIINQTDPRWELIIIDDGSEKTTAEYCDSIGNKDSRIIIYHQHNSGLSTARNYGMDNAKTPWVTFIDADDWIEMTYVEELLKVINGHNELEVLTFGHDDIYGEKIIPRLWGVEKYHKFDASENVGMQLSILHDPIGSENYPMFFGAQWKMVYSLQFLNKFKIRNNPELLKAQDSVFNLYVTENAVHVGYYNRVLYHYFHNSASVTGETYNKNTDRTVKLLKAYCEFLTSTNKLDIEIYADAYKNNLLLHLEYMLDTCYLNKKNKDSVEDKVKGIRELISNEPYVSAFVSGLPKNISLFKKYMYRALKEQNCFIIICLHKAKRIKNAMGELLRWIRRMK